MTVMDLKSLCTKNIVGMIKKLPPLIRDEVIGEVIKEIKKEAKETAKKEIIKEIRKYAPIVVEDITGMLIQSHRECNDWKRPEYTNDIDDELYHTFVDISERFVMNNTETLVFGNVHRQRKRKRDALWDDYNDNSDDNSYDNSDDNSDDNMDY